MTFDEWVAREGAYLNDDDDAAKAARLMAGMAWSVAQRNAHDQMLAEVARLTQICTNAHDQLLRGADDNELLALLASGWKQRAGE